jgi:hypothetical protein
MRSNSYGYVFRKDFFTPSFVSNKHYQPLKANIMKKIYLLLSFLFISTLTIAQGIAVQGIARDNTSSAITDTNLTFTFSITKEDNTLQYAETQSIKTDNFGVFSHIVSTGNPNTNTFNDVDFALDNLKLKVSINYNSSNIEVYDQPFQYTPYAHFAKRAASADDGVPTGAVMPYLGTVAPTGWALCNGAALPTTATELRAMVGSNAPNLGGMFLRGAGPNTNSGYAVNDGPAVKTIQGDLNKNHNHSATSNTAGNHTHSEKGITTPGHYTSNASYWAIPNPVLGETQTGAAGSHQHTITVSPDGGSESRPVNYGVNYIIKL